MVVVSGRVAYFKVDIIEFLQRLGMMLVYEDATQPG
jgi:hypothetical protein